MFVALCSGFSSVSFVRSGTPLYFIKLGCVSRRKRGISFEDTINNLYNKDGMQACLMDKISLGISNLTRLKYVFREQVMIELKTWL